MEEQPLVSEESNAPDSAVIPTQVIAKIAQPGVEDEVDYPLITHGKGHRFRVDGSNEEELIFSYPVKPNGKQRAPDTFSYTHIQQVCQYLHDHFGDGPFPLANNVQRLGNETAEPGLGMAIRSIPLSVTHSQASSYLGPFLEHLAVFHLVHPRPASWQLIQNPNTVTAALQDYFDEV